MSFGMRRVSVGEKVLDVYRVRTRRRGAASKAGFTVFAVKNDFSADSACFPLFYCLSGKIFVLYRISCHDYAFLLHYVNLSIHLLHESPRFHLATPCYLICKY